MIDFRYHIVSIIAIFLALAVGIVVGTTALNGPLVDDLRGRNRDLIDDKRGLERQVGQLKDRTATDEQFARAVAPALLDRSLANQRVVIVALPGVDGDLRENTAAALTAAGATVTGAVALREGYSDPERSVEIDELVNRIVPAGIDLPSGTAQRAAAVLAAGLVQAAGAESSRPVAEADAEAALAAYREAELLEGEVEGRANLAVVLAGDPVADDDEREAQLETLLAVPAALNARTNGTVVAGTVQAAGDGGLVAAVRGDDLRERVSTVDGVETASGRIAAVLTLAAERRNEVGHYGAAEGAAGPLPSPLPAS